MSELEEALLELSPREFEVFIAELWGEKGWDTRVTRQSNDDGVDVVAKRDEYYPEKVLLQAKHKHRDAVVSRSAVQQYSYLHHKDNVDQVFLITTATFTDGAYESASQANVKLIDRETLVELIKDAAAEDKLANLGYHIKTESDRSEDEMQWQTPSDVPESAVAEIEDYADSPDVYARLLATLGLSDLPVKPRLCVLLQLFSGSDPVHGSFWTTPTNSGEELTQRASELAPNSVAADCARLDRETLTGRYARYGDIFPGLLREADAGIVRLAQLSALDDADRALLEPLEKGTITVSENGFNDTYEIQSSVLATVRPEFEQFDEYEPLGNQLRLNWRLLSAFDFVSIYSKADNRRIFRLPPQWTSLRKDVSPVSKTLFRQHIVLANGLEPTLTADAIEELEDICNTIDAQIEGGLVEAWKDSLRNLGKASARIRLSEKVTPSDIHTATVGFPWSLSRSSNDEVSESMRSFTRGAVGIVWALSESLLNEDHGTVEVSTIRERAMELGMKSADVTKILSCLVNSEQIVVELDGENCENFPTENLDQKGEPQPKVAEINRNKGPITMERAREALVKGIVAYYQIDGNNDVLEKAVHRYAAQNGIFPRETTTEIIRELTEKGEIVSTTDRKITLEHAMPHIDRSGSSDSESTGDGDLDVVEAGTSKSQRDRINSIRKLIESIETEYDSGAPVDVVIKRAGEQGMKPAMAEHEIDELKQKGEVYEPKTDHLRTT
jgi:DNA replicative helicase MCM subunit Mcm2 (Cdc46/Mcm family)